MVYCSSLDGCLRRGVSIGRMLWAAFARIDADSLIALALNPRPTLANYQRVSVDHRRPPPEAHARLRCHDASRTSPPHILVLVVHPHQLVLVGCHGLSCYRLCPLVRTAGHWT